MTRCLFSKGIYLNITAKKGTAMNAVLYMVTAQEIAAMDLYEFGYERVHDKLHISKKAYILDLKKVVFMTDL
uniref:hypothetical protein n=1 Tax=Mariniflexile sp. TaxID=1979402 RepID=UPI0040489F8D